MATLPSADPSQILLNALVESGAIVPLCRLPAVYPSGNSSNSQPGPAKPSSKFVSPRFTVGSCTWAKEGSGSGACHSNLLSPELWLAKGDLAQARPQAERFLKIALASAEHTWRALAWEANARVAMAELDLTRAQDCIAKGLSAMEGFEVPLAAWRVHATAFELHQNSGDRDVAERHLALSRETVMKLANSLPTEEPLRQT
jgi:hypothetical protein